MNPSAPFAFRPGQLAVVGERVCRWLGPAALLVLFLAWSWPVRAQEPAPVNPVVARVGQVEIRTDSLAPAEEMMQLRRASLGRELAASWERELRRENLRQRIVKELIKLFSREQGLAVTPEDVDSYCTFLDWRFRIYSERWAQKQAELIQRSEKPDLSETVRAGLLKRVEELDSVVERYRKFYQRAKEEAGAGVAPGQARKFSAAGAILRWKAFKALYERYGGKVVCDALELVPVGALEALVKERLQTFTVILLDPDDQDLFDDYQGRVRGPHVEASRRQAEAYFSQPWWVVVQQAAPAAEDSSQKPPASD